MSPAKEKPRDKQFLNTKELGERWGFHEQTIYSMRRDGTGPSYIKFGQKVQYPIAEVKKFEAARLVKSKALRRLN